MLKLPYVSICSDAGSIAAEGANMNGGAHPRMYGSFARLLGKYVRDEKIMSLQEAIRRMTLLPATHLNINRRGLLKVGNYADVAVFNPENVKDQATFESPHQYAEGMMHVFVNGGQVLQYGEHTNLRAGRLIKRNKPK
jgi:N-acyl-D-amino-acid deacylase